MEVQHGLIDVARGQRSDIVEHPGSIDKVSIAIASRIARTVIISIADDDLSVDVLLGVRRVAERPGVTLSHALMGHHLRRIEEHCLYRRTAGHAGHYAIFGFARALVGADDVARRTDWAFYEHDRVAATGRRWLTRI